MEQKTIEIEAPTLGLARQQVQDQLPARLVVISEKILRQGVSKSISSTARTEADAFAKARRKCPRNAHITAEKVITPSVNQPISVAASDEHTAKEQALSVAHSRFGEDVNLVSIELTTGGKSGFLGIGRQPNQYTAVFHRDAAVELTYQTPAKIAATIGTPEEKLIASLNNYKEDQCDEAIDQIANMDDDQLSAFGDQLLEPLVVAAWIDRATGPAARKRDDAVVHILRRLGDPVFTYLTRLLRDDSNFRRALMACIPLVRLGDPPHVDNARNRIIVYINGADRYPMIPAVEAMTCIGDAYAVDYLANVVLPSHPNEQVRAQAAIGLGLIGDPTAVPALIKALDDPSTENVQICASHSLKQLTGSETGAS